MQNFVAIGASLHASARGAAGRYRRPVKTYRWTILAMVIGVALLTLAVVLLVG